MVRNWILITSFKDVVTGQGNLSFIQIEPLCIFVLQTCESTKQLLLTTTLNALTPLSISKFSEKAFHV
ncbi:hypothetical protein L596_008484 [Steinernema carpocapsae]|uniref:Uncharacterized protein n=1 Tax=Steinernema carpocapsae TaxID=34508 RepID=A0A4U5PCW9_STECR|nr:hypothetical protein L596_008484 [Steinernema carpocapsae]